MSKGTGDAFVGGRQATCTCVGMSWPFVTTKSSWVSGCQTAVSGFEGPARLPGMVWPGVILAFPAILPLRVTKFIFWFGDLCLSTWWNSQSRASPFP